METKWQVKNDTLQFDCVISFFTWQNFRQTCTMNDCRKCLFHWNAQLQQPYGAIRFTKESLIKVNCDLFNSSTPLSCDLYLWQLKLIAFFGLECVTLFELSLSTRPVVSFALRSFQVGIRHWQTFREWIKNCLMAHKCERIFQAH